MPIPATTGVLRNRIEDMEIGDYIAIAVNNDIGGYQFGVDISQYTERPVEGLPGTQNGYYWYGIKVDEGLIISDRVTSHATSWDVQNASRNIEGQSFVREVDGLPLVIRVRSLKGGIYYRKVDGEMSLSNLEKGTYPASNEWDKYILGFQEGLIQVDKTSDDIFNWTKAGSWCQETPANGVIKHFDGALGSPSQRAMHDRSGRLSFATSSSSSTVYGFRPVFEYRDNQTRKQALEDYKQHMIAHHAVSLFRFDEASGNVTDAKGSAVGTITGGVTRVTGWNGIGRALSFNGSNGYVQFNQKVVSTGTHSILFKIKLGSSLPASHQTLMANQISWSEIGFRITLNPDGSITFTNCKGGSESNGVSNAIYNVNYSFSDFYDNQWHDVLFSYSAENFQVKLIVDNIALSPSTYILNQSNIQTLNSTRNFVLGRWDSSSGYRYFNGQIDELEIYNDILRWI